MPRRAELHSLFQRDRRGMKRRETMLLFGGKSFLIAVIIETATGKIVREDLTSGEKGAPSKIRREDQKKTFSTFPAASPHRLKGLNRRALRPGRARPQQKKRKVGKVGFPDPPAEGNSRRTKDCLTTRHRFASRSRSSGHAQHLGKRFFPRPEARLLKIRADATV